MIFTNKELNSNKYDFSNKPNLKKDIFSYRDVCKELSVFTQKIYELLSNDVIVETVEKGKDKKGYIVELNSLQKIDPVKSSSHTIHIFDRDEDDIYRIIVSKHDFKKNLEKLGFFEPENKGSIDFAYYLQVVYFIYICIYFIFPGIKFYDLYDDNNLSSENTLESNTGNEKYEKFIIDNLYQNKVIKNRQIERINKYNESIQKYQDAFFGYYEIMYYWFIEMPAEGGKGLFENSLSKTNSEKFKKYFDEEYRKNIDVLIDNQLSRNLIDRYFDYINEKQTLAVINDFESNLKYLMPYFNGVSNDKSDIDIPFEYENAIVYEEDIVDILEEDDFIKTIMCSDKLTNSIKNKFYGYDFIDAIDGVWEFEKAQMNDYDNSGFLFLKKDRRYFMYKSDIAIICLTLKNMNLNVSYLCKRIYLENRSDAQKKATHSIKRSYKVADDHGYSASVSTLRDGIFRILCRLLLVKAKNGNCNEFMYFELPMNTLIYSYMRIAERNRSLENKTEYYTKTAELLNN